MEIYNAEVGTKFGWESAKEDTDSPDLEDYRRNGQYCLTGLAYNSALNEATCVATSSVEFKSSSDPTSDPPKKLEAPYPCNPEHPQDRCHIKFDTSASTSQWLSVGQRDKISVNCSCSLSDETTGYCKDVIGTDPYVKYAR